MTDGLKIVRILARNVPRTRSQALRRRRVSRVSLAPRNRRCAVLDAPGRCPVETQQIVSRQPEHILQAVTSKKESCRDSMSSSL